MRKDILQIKVNISCEGGYDLLAADCRRGSFVTLNIKASFIPFLFLSKSNNLFSRLGVKYRISKAPFCQSSYCT